MDAYDAIADEAGKLGLPFAGHVPDRVGVEHALEKRRAMHGSAAWLHSGSR
jgi:hypothetical protein